MPRPSCCKAGLPEQHRPERASLYGVAAKPGFGALLKADELMGCWRRHRVALTRLLWGQTWRKCNLILVAHHQPSPSTRTSSRAVARHSPARASSADKWQSPMRRQSDLKILERDVPTISFKQRDKSDSSASTLTCARGDGYRLRFTSDPSAGKSSEESGF